MKVASESFMAEGLRSVLFVDFDNVFFSLQSADKDAAKAFAENPQGWLEAIETGELIDEGNTRGRPVRRRILMRRCYANPAVMRYFRGHFTRSGFQIVDCPPLTGKGKNSADIYMVVDMLDALRHDTRFDEFIILSGDADFTPVLTRLRAYDRRSVIYSNAVTAAAYKALCDGMITEERLIDRGGDEVDDEEAEAAAPVVRVDRRPAAIEPPRGGLRRPVPARFAADDAVGDGISAGARLPRLPEEIEALVRRVTAATNVPAFAPEVYAALFRALAAEVQEHSFSLNRTVNATIRRLSERGLRLRPQAVAFVVKGLMLSGHEFDPGDTAGTLAKAFRRQVLYLAANADLVLGEEDRAAVGVWIVGALRSVPAAEATATDPAASEIGRAAEGAHAADEADEEVDGLSGTAADDDDRYDGESGSDDDGSDPGEDEGGEADGDGTETGPSRPARNIEDLLARMRTAPR